MPSLTYPGTLPGPTAWQIKPDERRQGREMREPSNAFRLRSLDYGADVQAEWIYSAAEMAIWRAWFEGASATQLARNRWFTATVPGPGGAVDRVLRYVTPPAREYLTNGVFKVSATLRVRGTGVAPQQDITAPGADSFELREDGTRELREDGTYELRG
jgi:hypothetical protein